MNIDTYGKSPKVTLLDLTLSITNPSTNVIPSKFTNQDMPPELFPYRFSWRLFMSTTAKRMRRIRITRMKKRKIGAIMLTISVLTITEVVVEAVMKVIVGGVVGGVVGRVVGVVTGVVAESEICRTGDAEGNEL